MDELKKQAEDLGIKVDGRWSEERLQAEIDEALLAQMSAEEERKAREAAAEREDKLRLDSEAQVKAFEEEQASGSVVITNLQPNPMRSLGLVGYGESTITPIELADRRFAAKIERAKNLGLIKVGK